MAYLVLDRTTVKMFPCVSYIGWAGLMDALHIVDKEAELPIDVNKEDAELLRKLAARIEGKKDGP